MKALVNLGIKLGVCSTLMMIVICSVAIAAMDPDEQVDESIVVTVQGKLNSQVVAIGGETTGFQISAKGIKWELDFGDNVKLRKLAEKLHEQQVTVTGELSVKPGVEIRRRWIVAVASLKAAGDEGGYLDEEGKLKHPLIFKDAQGGFAGFSGHIWTIEPDGSWRRQPFLNKDVREADQQGMLTANQLANLAHKFEQHDLLGLPEKIGKDVGANPHVFSIGFGKKQASLTLMPGAELPDVDEIKTPADRFAKLGTLILGAMEASVEK